MAREACGPATRAGRRSWATSGVRTTALGVLMVLVLDQAVRAQHAHSVTPQASATLHGWQRTQAYHSLYGLSSPQNPTQTREWKQGGNNWDGYMAVLARKQATAEYREMLKRQQEIDRWLSDQATRQSRGQPVDPRYAQLLQAQDAYQAQLSAALTRAQQSARARRDAQKLQALPEDDATIEARLVKARTEYQDTLMAYRQAVRERIETVGDAILKSGSEDLSNVFKREREAFEDGGPPPPLVRTKKYASSWRKVYDYWKDARADLIAALDAARQRASRAGKDELATRLDAERKGLPGVFAFTGSAPTRADLLPTAGSTNPPVWLYTTSDPGLGWAAPEFEADGWLRGRAGFGGRGIGKLRVGTQWDKERIWLRMAINVPWRSPDDAIILRLRYDEDAEIYVNGELLMHAPGYNGNYEDFFLTDGQKKLVREGRNTIAVFCRNTGGAQGIDMGLTLLRGGSDLVASASNARGDDRMEPGAAWEGPRTYLDRIEPGYTSTIRLVVLQRMGNQVRMKITLGTTRGGRPPEVLGEGVIRGNAIQIRETGVGQHALILRGSFRDNRLAYEFRGKGQGGGERYGKGELSRTDQVASR